MSLLKMLRKPGIDAARALCHAFDVRLSSSEFAREEDVGEFGLAEADLGVCGGHV